MMARKPYISRDQKGMVSLIVTVIVMFVLTVTVIGFASLMRREQRQTLDRQINTQAFYAAESGINDAISKLNALPVGDPAFSINFDNCNSGSPANDFVARFSGSLNRNINTSSNVSYSCLLVNPKPKSLEYGDIGETPQIIPVTTPAPTHIDHIVINWQDKGGSSNFACPGAPPTLPDLVAIGSWGCSTGLLRLDVVKVDTPFTRDDLNQNLRTFFLYPQATAFTTPATPAAPGSNTGIIVAANCNASQTPKFCGVSLDVSAFSSGQFYMRVTSLYNNSAVSVRAYSSGVQVDLTGAQAIIDSTGKSNDVLRRVQARVSLNPLGKGPFPGAAIQSADSICKKIYTIPPSTVDLDPADGAINAANNPCGLN